MQAGTSAIERLRAVLKSRGARGIVGLGRVFRNMDDDGSKGLNYYEFEKGMHDMGVGLRSAEMQALFKFFDANGNGSVDYDEFLVGVRGSLNPRRRQLVGQAYARFDKNGDGVVSVDDLAGVYDTSHHPDVIAGRKTTDQVQRRPPATYNLP